MMVVALSGEMLRDPRVEPDLNDLVYPLVPGAGSRETVTTTYDGLGQPFDLVGSQTYVDAAAWTAQGQPFAWTLGDGSVNRSWAYDPATLRATQYAAGTSQLGGSSTGNLVLLGHQYDDSGNVTRIQDSLNSSHYAGGASHRWMRIGSTSRSQPSLNLAAARSGGPRCSSCEPGSVDG